MSKYHRVRFILRYKLSSHYCCYGNQFFVDALYKSTFTYLLTYLLQTTQLVLSQLKDFLT